MFQKKQWHAWTDLILVTATVVIDLIVLPGIARGDVWGYNTDVTVPIYRKIVFAQHIVRLLRAVNYWILYTGGAQSKRPKNVEYGTDPTTFSDVLHSRVVDVVICVTLCIELICVFAHILLASHVLVPSLSNHIAYMDATSSGYLNVVLCFDVAALVLVHRTTFFSNFHNKVYFVRFFLFFRKRKIFFYVEQFSYVSFF